MTKPKAKTTNAKKTSPLAKKGKLAFVQPELNSTQTIGEALDEIRQGKVNSAFRTKKPNTDLTNDANVQELFKDHIPTTVSEYGQLETQLGVVEADLRKQLNTYYEVMVTNRDQIGVELYNIRTDVATLTDNLRDLNFKVNVAIAVGLVVVVTTGIFNLWYWFS